MTGKTERSTKIVGADRYKADWDSYFHLVLFQSCVNQYVINVC